jgi:hypothetical protein
MINVRVLGVRKIEGKIRAMTTKMPKEMNDLGRYIATDIRRGARLRETVRRTHGIALSKGWLTQSINAFKVGEGKNHVTWGAGIGIDIAGNIDPKVFYANIQERGITGWHFVPKIGAGMFGVGYSAPGDRLPKAGGKYFFRDAVFSTRMRLPNILATWEKRMVKG